jgi:asparagine synthetase B (glutamine-hydrolysing)
MPALVVVRSTRGDAGVRARAAAAAILRQPWERLQLWEADDSTTAVAFAGESGGIAVCPRTECVAAVDGELFVDDVLTTGPEAAVALLRDREAGAELGTAEGGYAAALWDPRTRAVTIATDRYATRPLYVTSDDRTTLVTGELKAVPAVFPARRTIDLDTAAAFLAYEHTFPRQALIQGVNALPSGVTDMIGESGEMRRTRRWRFELAPEPLADPREWVAEFGRQLDRAVARRLDPATFVTISGGLDSRCVVLSLVRQGLESLTVTYGAIGSGDLALGAAVAEVAGLRHGALRLEPGYIARWAPEAAWLYDGRFRALACHHLCLRVLREDGVRSALIGFSGDDALRDVATSNGAHALDGAFIRAAHMDRARCLDDELLETHLTPSFAAALRGRAEAALASELLDDVGAPAARVSQLRFRNTQSPTLFADHFPARDPFADYAFVDFARTIPVELRRHGLLQRLFLRTHPELARLSTTYHRAPPAASKIRVEIAARLAALRHRVRPELAAISGLGSYAADLRSESRSLLGLLVDQTTLDRGQFEPRAMRRLVERTIGGHVSDMRVVGVLLTLELFQRQFIDRDASTTRLDGDLPLGALTQSSFPAR